MNDVCEKKTERRVACGVLSLVTKTNTPHATPFMQTPRPISLIFKLVYGLKNAVAFLCVRGRRVRRPW